MLRLLSGITDRLEHLWEERVMSRSAGTLLVIAYLLTIVVIEMRRQGILPEPFVDIVPTNHFFAVDVAFTLLLATEVVSLIFSLTRSFSRSIGVQIEILSLILLRDTFKKFTQFSEPLEWEPISEVIGTMVADAAGALAIFVILGVYYRAQRRRPITRDEVEQTTFIMAKKVIGLGLLASFVTIGLVDLLRIARNETPYPFFDSFYTILIFTDVLMVLLSLRYSTNYSVTFRNFSYAIVTVFIRLALIAPAPLNVAIGLGTALFGLGITLAYNIYGVSILQGAEHQEDIHPDDPEAMQLADEQVKRQDAKPAGDG